MRKKYKINVIEYMLDIKNKSIGGKTMKKDFIFAPIMLVVGILLFMLRATGMTAHIIISVLGWYRGK